MNVPPESLADRIWAMPASHGRERIRRSGLTLLPARQVAPPLIGECKAHLECELRAVTRLGEEVVVYGTIVGAAGLPRRFPRRGEAAAPAAAHADRVNDPRLIREGRAMALSARSRPGAVAAASVLGRARLRFAARVRGWILATWRERAHRRALPAVVSAELSLERGERVLRTARGPAGWHALIATDRALHHRDPAGPGWSRLGWERIAGVDWDAAGGRLVIAGLAGAAPSRTLIPLRARGTVPELVRERITHTRLGRWQLPVAGAGPVLIEARRRPVTGELLWFVTRDAGGHGPASGDVDRQVERAVARLCADLGLSHLPGAAWSPDGPRESPRPLPMLPSQ